MNQYLVTTWQYGVKRTQVIGANSAESLRKDFGKCDRVLIQKTVDLFGWGGCDE